MMSLWDALRMNMMISYQELVRTFLSIDGERQYADGFVNGMVASHLLCHSGTINRHSLNGALLS